MDNRALGRYQLRGELGRGTMGVVYRAYDPVLEREIALKTVELAPGLDPPRREKFLARFFQEAKIAARLLHPNIVVTHDAATDETTRVPFIAMELVTGGSLADRLVKAGALDWRRALELGIPLARALDYAHRQGVVHRDIKPANVMLTEEEVPKIADFGIARLPTSELTQTGAILGTPYFMSPEQLDSDAVDGRSDLFSLGALLYTLVAGRSPFRGDDLAAITHKVLFKDPPPLSEQTGSVPPSLDGVLARAMAKRRDDRYPTGEELASELERLARGEAPARAISLGERTLESASRSAPSRASEPSAPELVLEREPDSGPKRSAVLRTLVLLVLGAALALGVLSRWEPISAALGPFAEDLKGRVLALEGQIRDRQAELARRRELEARAEQQLEAARAAFGRAHWSEALDASEAGLAVAREGGLGFEEARALVVRGLVLAETGEWSRARADLDAAASIFEIYDEPEAEAGALVELADLERDLGEAERAESLYARARELGAAERVALGRAVAALVAGDLDRARLELAACARSESTRAQAELYLAALDLASGEHAAAERHLTAAASGVPAGEIALVRGVAARLRGDEDEARIALEHAVECFRSEDHQAGLEAALEAQTGTPLEDSALRAVLLAAPRTARSEARWSRLPGGSRASGVGDPVPRP